MKTEPTKQTILEAYFAYWQRYVRPIEEERIRSQFDQILIDVGLRRYGMDFALQLTYRFLKVQNAEVTGEGVVD